MNQRDTSRIARSLGAAYPTALHAQTAATAWFACIEAVADAIADVQPGFDRAPFLAECRAPSPVEAA